MSRIFYELIHFNKINDECLVDLDANGKLNFKTDSEDQVNILQFN